MKLGFCRGFPGAGVVSSRYREKYRQKYTLRYRQDCENGWLRELSSQGISSQLSNFPRCQLLGFLASWLLGFRFSSLSSRESLSFLCGSGACGASGTLSLVPRSFVLCYSLFALSAQPSQAPGWRGEPPPSIWEGGSRGTEGALPLVLLESKKPTRVGVGLFSRSR